MRQKSQKTDKNQGGKQKTQWDSNSGGVGEVGGEAGTGGRGILGSHILRTYLQQKGQGGGSGGGGICIDPQDSDHEQLEIEGTEYKCGPITSAAVFKGM